MSKFIIFASARSGSTSLARVLGESPDVKMSIEPFHPKYIQWNPEERNYSEFIKDEKTMNQALDELFSKYTAIKVLDYQFDKEIYYAMLDSKDLKILFLRRRNRLAGAISSAVAHQTSEWHKQDKLSIYENLKPIDMNEIGEWIKYIGEMNELYGQYLGEHRKGEYLPLFYEELYSESLEANKKTLAKICDFLNIAAPPNEAIIKHMTPANAKINFEDIYRKIPNYDEIIKRFGNEFVL